ncbi:MAG: NAD(P)(+) transhydrogenase (Re/Si-specific) subunit beta [Deltaproteobacteria bacterium]|nr:NAD(P)(+) transhydrogenase (Re/Si-specific) subunit beta [Deltaproteobacteria bacterium]
MTTHTLIQFFYLGSAILFILSLRGLRGAESARRGLFYAELGMLLAIIGTLLKQEIISYEWILVGLIVGTAIGTPMGLWIPMTKMPERIALSHAFGGLAVTLVGVSEYYLFKHHGASWNVLKMTATGAEVLLGAITFTGSLMAFGKLQGILPGRPTTYPMQNVSNVLMLVAAVGIAIYMVFEPGAEAFFYIMAAAGALLGILLVMPIGGADMPVVICLLNSYAGLAASATGFAIDNNALIICGALDGGSGFILALMMSKAMNRSFGNVIFGAFGTVQEGPAGTTATGPAPNTGSVDDAVEILRVARSVIVIPGYGMAVSQAQHAVRDLSNALKANGAEVRYAIHPVAGRMPGHMNVLLAEANVAYEDLYDLDDINGDFSATDVALVVGANDVVNPAARTNKASPIYGMPVFNTEEARSVIVLKRTLNPGFAGIENELFIKTNTMLVLGDAKRTIQSFASGLKESSH